VSLPHADEIATNLERAEQSIQAARQMAAGGFNDFAASRAYYAAFYAATAVLLNEGLELSKHSAVIASIHQRFVKTGKLSKEHGKSLGILSCSPFCCPCSQHRQDSRPKARESSYSSLEGMHRLDRH
jgi:hypothetical protein